MNIVFNANQISHVKKLISLCPSVFSFVPLKIYKDESGQSFVSIETISINGDVVFSGNIKVEDVSELEAGTGMVVRLPLSKPVINNIFGSKFESIEISKTKIVGKDKRKKLSIALYKMEEDEITEFPFDSESLFTLVKEMNNIDSCPYTVQALDEDDMKDIMSGFNVINDATSVDITAKNKKIKFKVEDFAGNDFEYNVETDDDEEFSAKFDGNFIKILGTAYKNKDSHEISMLFSSLIFSLTVKDDVMSAAIATTALKD